MRNLLVFFSSNGKMWAIELRMFVRSSYVNTYFAVSAISVKIDREIGESKIVYIHEVKVTYT